MLFPLLLECSLPGRPSPFQWVELRLADIGLPAICPRIEREGSPEAPSPGLLTLNSLLPTWSPRGRLGHRRTGLSWLGQTNHRRHALPKQDQRQRPGPGSWSLSLRPPGHGWDSESSSWLAERLCRSPHRVGPSPGRRVRGHRHRSWKDGEGGPPAARAWPCPTVTPRPSPLWMLSAYLLQGGFRLQAV